VGFSQETFAELELCMELEESGDRQILIVPLCTKLINCVRGCTDVAGWFMLDGGGSVFIPGV
jgi:hypothetical protein